MRVTLSDAAPIAAITVQNQGPESAIVQLRPMRWTQVDGADLYETSEELIATPPIFTVVPGGSQVVRMGLRRPQNVHRERAFRLYLQEVPTAALLRSGGAQVALRLGVPIFVSPAVIEAQALQWQLVRATDGSLAIVCSNVGSTHARISSVEISVAGATSSLVEQPIAADVHAAGRSEWKIRDRTASLVVGTWVRLRAETERGVEIADVLVP